MQVRWCKCEGRKKILHRFSKNKAEKINIFFSTVVPKTAEFFFSAVFEKRWTKFFSAVFGKTVENFFFLPSHLHHRT